MLAAHPALLRRTVIGVFLGLVLIVAISAVAGGMDGRAPQSFFAAALDPAPTPRSVPTPAAAASLPSAKAGEAGSPSSAPAAPVTDDAGDRGGDVGAGPVVIEPPAAVPLQSAATSACPRTTTPTSPPEAAGRLAADVTRSPSPDTTAAKKNGTNAGAIPN